MPPECLISERGHPMRGKESCEIWCKAGRRRDAGQPHRANRDSASQEAQLWDKRAAVLSLRLPVLICVTPHCLVNNMLRWVRNYTDAHLKQYLVHTLLNLKCHESWGRILLSHLIIKMDFFEKHASLTQTLGLLNVLKFIWKCIFSSLLWLWFKPLRRNMPSKTRCQLYCSQHGNANMILPVYKSLRCSKAETTCRFVKIPLRVLH